MAGIVVSTDLPTRARYSQCGGIYRIIPAAVAHPVDRAGLLDALAYAEEHQLAITCRGAGSAMDGSCVGHGLIVDMSGYDAGRCEVDTTGRRATASPGVTLADLNRAAAAHHLRLPVDPSSAEWARVGAATATNASGAHSVQVGSMRRWVASVTLETADGPLRLGRGVAADEQHPVVQRWRATTEPLLQRHAETIHARYPAVRKNSAGYALDHYLASGDLLDIVIGSEGTLGVITEVVVGLAPIPAARVALRVAVGRRDDLPEIIETLRLADPATLELLDVSFLRLVRDGVTDPADRVVLDGSAGLLLVDLEGDDRDELLARASAAVASLRRRVLDIRVASDPDEVARLWQVRHRASPMLAGLTDGRRSLQVIEDGCVPVDCLPAYLDAIERAAAAQRIDVVMFGHAGDGHVHVNLLPNVQDEDWLPRVRAIYAGVSRAVIALGGTPSGEHGTGRLRAGLMENLYGADVVTCFCAVRAAFDPQRRFNPGVITSDGADPFSELKVGAKAVPLPVGIEQELWRIEAGAGWGKTGMGS